MSPSEDYGPPGNSGREISGDVAAEEYGDAISKEFGGCNSFTGSTLVLLGDGRPIPIPRVKAGEKVAAANPLTGQVAAEMVTRTFITRTDTDFTALTVKTPNGLASIVSTTRHPYWDATIRRWTSAGSLHGGDRLLSWRGQPVTITSVHNFTWHAITYNLTVNNLHTYFVEVAGIAVLVHNSGGPGPCSLGRVGEASAGISKNTQRININGRWRIPDQFDPEDRIIGEVKNVKYQYLSTQLRDDLDYARQHDYTLILYVNSNTRLSSTLEKLWADGEITVVRF